MKRSKQMQLHSGARTGDIPAVIQHFRTAPQQQSNGELDAALFYDLNAFEQTLSALKLAFPSNFQHTLAVKANPLLAMLKIGVEKYAFGLECASLTEVELSIKAGCSPNLIMFDSPCKTKRELARALELGVQINCDSFEEFDRILALRNTTSTSAVGLRINPLLGFGAIRELSVSDATSKFGIPLIKENEERILRLFTEHAFLNALHVHVGSQGCSLDMLANGVLTVVQLANKLGKGRVKFLDLGGGLPTNFNSDACSPTFAEYAQVMRAKVPELFDADCAYTCLTEFGRSIQAKLGWAMSRCEYVKQPTSETRIAVIHFGSDMFLRTCYVPAQFALRVQVFDHKTGMEKTTGVEEKHNVVGPLCFGGDKICEGVMLPRIEVDDFVVVRDAGANCLSLWSRHCSRPSPAVFGYRIAEEEENDGSGGGGRRVVQEFVQLRKRETIDQVLQFWE